MKNTTTFSSSIPTPLLSQIDTIAQELNIARSAVLTIIVSLFLKESNIKEVIQNAT